MTTSFKRRFWKLSKWFLAVFVILFIFRFAYGYVVKDVRTGTDFSDDFFSSLGNVRKNYASEKMALKGDVQAESVVASNQKFEKTASIKAKSTEFDKDDKYVKAKTKEFNAVIQYEQNLGQKGNRQIHLLIGVNPGLFDKFYLEIQKVGIIRDKEITKVDKTNEYKQLNAKKISIENTLQSLKELKSKTGEISAFISLNEKILEVEEKLQELGVELGNFDSENEFCTVKLSLYEGATEKDISIMYRIKTSLQWTINYFGIMVASFLGVTLTVFILIMIIDRLKIMSLIAREGNKE